jgi:hypothetical protein
MQIAVWSFGIFILLGAAAYFQKRCADIEAPLAGEAPLWAFVGTTWFRGSTQESRRYRRLLVLYKLTGILAVVQVFRLLRG